MGVDTYSKLAYAVTTPGTTPSEEGLRLLLNRAHPEAVTVGALSSIRRLMFEGQTMVIAQIKRSVEGTESAKTAELAPAERESRIQAQKLRLVGLELSGHLECSHQSYDYVHRMLVLDAVSYLEPHRFTTRMSEVQHDKPPKKLVIDHQQLTIRDSERKDRCIIQDLFSLSQALTRRALACDLMGACTFRHMDGWHRLLLEQCQLPAPPHFEAPSMAQILRANRAAWVKLAETLPSLKPAADGSLPLDAALQVLRRDHTITFYLLPLPTHGGAQRASLPPRDDDISIFMSIRPSPSPSWSQHLQLNCAARSAYNSQPRGKRLKPLVREVKHVIRLRGPATVLQSLPPCCKEPVTLPSQVTSQPALPALPAGSRLLHTHLRPGGKACEPDLVEATYGVPWEPEEFVTMAIKQGHPSHFIESVPTRLKRCIDNIASSSLATVAQERTEAMRYWTLRAKETRDRERAAMKEALPHCRDVPKRKDLTLFGEMLQSIDYDDVDLCNDMRKGFDLMGDIPGPPSFPQKTTFATLTPEQVREVASETRQAIMLSAQSSRDREMDRELLEITLDEVDRGWLEGPIDMGRLMPTATVSRRFGVRQGSTAADGTRVFKVRPIDDLSESLINMTNGGEVTISPMGIDAIVAGLVHRLRQKPGAHLSAKTIDLRKAYKNLPVSGPALQDSHLMVFDPDTNEPQVFLSKVLPFGARASVMGFCRVAAGLWAAGVSIFHLHWTSYFDDFFLICEQGEEVHLEMAQRLFFQLLGWETSHEKEAEFAELARVLGVEIDLASAHLGEVMIRNTIGRVQEITTQIDEILALGRHCRGELKVLRGRLQFAEQQCFGRSSAWMVRVLSDAAENLNPGIIQRDLHKALRFLRDRLVQAEPRKVSSQVGTTWMLFTDAAFEPTTREDLGESCMTAMAKSEPGTGVRCRSGSADPSIQVARRLSSRSWRHSQCLLHFRACVLR